MEYLHKLTIDIQYCFEASAGRLLSIDSGVFSVVLVVLILLSLKSGRLFIICNATTLAILGYVLLIAPSAAIPTIALAAWFRSLLISCEGISTNRQEHLRRREFEKLSNVVRGLEAVAERELLRSLNSKPRATPEPLEGLTAEPPSVGPR